MSAVIRRSGGRRCTAPCSRCSTRRSPVDEIIVVADTDVPTSIFPPMTESCCCASRYGGGPARCRQLGIDAARGLGDRTARRRRRVVRRPSWTASLAVAESSRHDHWIVSSRMLVLGPGGRQRIWPRRLIEPGRVGGGVSVSFQRTSAFGGAVLQTSTLCFPTDSWPRRPVGRRMRMRHTMSRVG